MERQSPHVTLLHGTDFSHCSSHARDVAVQYAERLGAILHVVHVGGWLHGGDDVALLHSEVAPIVSVPVVERLLSGSPAAELARYARDCQAALIVVGTHGRTGIGRVFLGGVSQRLLHLAHCPVLVVPPPARASAAVTVPETAPAAHRCLLCGKCGDEVQDVICETCAGLVRGEAIMRQQEEARKARH